MAKGSTRRERRPAAERREAILRAARAQFTEAGYSGASLRGIADAADVDDATLYRLFPTKDALFEEAIAAPLQQAVTNAFRPAPGDAEVRDVSEEFVRELLEGMRDIAPLMTAVLSDAERGAHLYKERVEPALADLRESIDANLPKWAHRDFDPELAMLTVLGACWFIALHNRFGTKPTGEPAEIAPEILAIVWDGLRARPDSA